MLARVGTIYNAILFSLLSLSGILLIVALVAVCLDIVFRYFLTQPLIWATEITEYILLYSVFLGAAWVLKKDRHVRMDILLIRLSPGQRTLVNTVTSFVGAAICLLMAWQGTWVTWDHFVRGVPTNAILKIPMFLIIGIIPLGNLLLGIEFGRHGYDHWKKFTSLQGKRPKIKVAD